MANGTLEEKLLRQGALEPREVLRIISQIAPALNLVHNHEIVHRDLKPANILFDAADDAHLADFGLAKWLVKATSDESMANIVGTPAYMPPEQADPTSGF